MHLHTPRRADGDGHTNALSNIEHNASEHLPKRRSIFIFSCGSAFFRRSVESKPWNRCCLFDYPPHCGGCREWHGMIIMKAARGGGGLKTMYVFVGVKKNTWSGG